MIIRFTKNLIIRYFIILKRLVKIAVYNIPDFFHVLCIHYLRRKKITIIFRYDI